MKRVRCVAVCLAFVCAAVYLAAEVQSVTPLQIPAGRNAKLLLRGTGLDGVQSCRIQPLAQTEGKPGNTPSGTPASGCVIFGKRKGGHTWKNTQRPGDLVIQVGGSDIPTPGLYLMLLSNTAPEKVPGDPIMDSVAVVKFRVFDGTMSASDDVAAAVSPNDVAHPYTDCVSQAPASGGLSAIPSRSDNVACGASMLTRGEVIDNFGRHVSDRYNAIQVRVANKNPKYDFLLRDIVLTLPDGRVVSGRIRRFASGVAVKGKTLDRRALAFNALTAVGQVYGALTVFASDGFKTAGNIFQGAGLAGFSQVFPDTTAENVNRFNSAVFDDQNPAIVPKDSIGQPPLYVVALVPKEPGFESYDYAKEIQVAVEGTYIKQVSIVAMEAESGDFGAEFVSPEQLNSNGMFKALREKGKVNRFLVSNSNASPLNLRGIKIANDSATDLSPNFVLDKDKTTCTTRGQVPALGQPFSVAPNDQCAIYVRFQPQKPGALKATLSIDGDNLEGTHTAVLQGTGVGLVLTAPTPATPFACSYAEKNCTWDLPSSAGNAVAFQAAYAGKTSTSVIITPGGYQVHASTDWSNQVRVSVNLSSLQSSLPITISGEEFSSEPYKVTVNLQTTDTTVTLSIENPNSSDVTVTAMLAGGTNVDGSVIFSVNGVLQSPVQVLNNAAVLHVKTGGKDQTVMAEYSGTRMYRSSKSGSIKVSVLPAALSVIPDAVYGGKVVTIPNLSVKAADGNACTGTVALNFSQKPDGATDANLPAQSLNGGVATLKFTASKSGTYTGTVAYITDGTTCASSSTFLTLHVP